MYNKCVRSLLHAGHCTVTRVGMRLGPCPQQAQSPVRENKALQDGPLTLLSFLRIYVSKQGIWSGWKQNKKANSEMS